MAAVAMVVAQAGEGAEEAAGALDGAGAEPPENSFLMRESSDIG